MAAIGFKVTGKITLNLLFCIKVIPDALPGFNHCERHLAFALKNKIVACLNGNRAKCGRFSIRFDANSDSVKTIGIRFIVGIDAKYIGVAS